MRFIIKGAGRKGNVKTKALIQPLRARVAFTLIELMFAVIIVSILAAIIYPQFQSGRTRAALKEVPDTVMVIRAAVRYERQKTGDWYVFADSSWGNKADYARAQDDLHITLPDPTSNETMCRYLCYWRGAPINARIIQFSRIGGAAEGYYRLDNDTYHILAAGTWTEFLMYLDSDATPD